MPKSPKPKTLDALTHDKARRINNPTAELQDLAEQQEEGRPLGAAHFQRARPLAAGEVRERDADLDPQIVWNGARITLTKEQAKQLAETGTVEIGDAQLVWRGKDRQDWSDLVVNQPMIYVQEKVHPKAIIDDLKRRTGEARNRDYDEPDLFADFNGLPSPEARAEFYQHGLHWANRMILGDSLQVMASLAGREGLKGKVQCIYFDPPYGIKFNSNWQVSTQSRDVKDGKREDVSREPEQVKAFRDTWKDGIHSYLTYLRDRLTVARELLTESGSIFVQIGDENVHRVRALMDEVFGAENLCGLIGYKKTTGAGSPAIGTDVLASVKDYIVWFARNKGNVKYRQLYLSKEAGELGAASYNRAQRLDGSEIRPLSADQVFGRDFDASQWWLVASDNLTSQTGVATTQVAVNHRGESFTPAKGGWKTNATGLQRLGYSSRLTKGGTALRYVRRLLDFAVAPINNDWGDTSTGSFTEEKVYVVQSGAKAVQRCILMATDPGDLVLDPTCGSGTTATVAEQWGRRWITIDTSRVALALARTRLMSARYPYYLLRDSAEGRAKEQEVTGRIQPDGPTLRDVRQGFVYERVPHVTLKSIANNAEIDVIWEKWQRTLEPLRAALNTRIGRSSAPNAHASSPRPDGERASRLGEPSASLGEKGEGATPAGSTGGAPSPSSPKLGSASPSAGALSPTGRGEAALRAHGELRTANGEAGTESPLPAGGERALSLGEPQASLGEKGEGGSPSRIATGAGSPSPSIAKLASGSPSSGALSPQAGRGDSPAPAVTGKPFEEWEIPRHPGDPWPEAAAKAHAAARDADAAPKKRATALAKINRELGRAYTLDTLPDVPADLWTDAEAIRLHAAWWEARIARQREIDTSIAKAADVELLYDRPYPDTAKVRVAGPFTVESLSPHRVVTARDDSLVDELAAAEGDFQRGPKNVPEQDFGRMVLENLKAAGVHQKDKADAIRFTSLEGWPGMFVAAEGRYAAEDGRERRAAIFIGPEFGTITRTDLTAAAREASAGRFDTLIACGFSYDAHASDLSKLGPLPIIKARMNPDLHMAKDLKNTGKGNLFVVFGEPDIDLLHEPSGEMRVKVNGVDVFDPSTGEIRSDGTEGIACWFIDTDYDEESFFVRHAYFLGANDPYEALKTALRAEIDEDAWATLYSAVSRPFARPATGRIAVKVINHFGDEVLKVFGV